MPHPGLAPHAAHKAVAANIAAKAAPGPERIRSTPLTVSERVFVVVAMIAAWIVMSVLSIAQR